MSRSALSAGLRRLRSQLAAQQHHEDSDEQLLHAFAAHRDEAAFAVLVRRHGPMVLHVCRRVLEHEQDAEDAFQATFLVLARKAATLRKNSALASFLHGTAYRLALSAKRAAARRRKHECQAPSRSPVDPVAELSWREVRMLLDEEIVRLPEKYRSVFILCCLEDLSRAEAAQRLGLSQRTVLSRLATARQRLSQRLGRRGVELTAVLAASTLAGSPASALSPLLISTTIQAALGEGMTGLVPAHIAALMESAASAATLSKTKMVTAVLLAFSLLAGAGAWFASVNRLWLGGEMPLAASKPPPLQANGRSAASRGNKESAPRQKQSEVLTVKGRVLGPDGKPIYGARLYSARTSQWLPQEDANAVVAPAQTEPTNAQGRFHVRIPKPDISEGLSFLIAHAAGFGVDWVNLNWDDLASEVTLRLVKDVPIAGRIVNTEGRPVAGVSVSLAQVWVPEKEKLDDYLHGYLRNFNGGKLNKPRKRLFVPLDAISGAAMTDKDGRFTLRGAGGERIVHVAFSGGGVARSAPFIITRPGFDAKPYNAVLQNKNNLAAKILVEWQRFLGLYPPEFTFVAEASKTIEGVVKDADTGKPVAGCRVIINTSYDHRIAAESNAEGKYRLEGLAKRVHGFDVWVDPPKHSSYLFKGVNRVPDTVGFSTIHLDFALMKGAIITGRVVDKRTGKGVRCNIRSIPLAGNKFFAAKRPFDPRNQATSRVIEAGADGRFRLVALPGPSLLAARVSESVNLRGTYSFLWVYREAVPDPDHKELFREDGGSWRVQTAGGSFEYLESLNAVKVADVKENGETRVELSVDPGSTARIVVQDADGKPLSGAWAAGLAAMRLNTCQLPEATATVYSLNPDNPREMVFIHAAKKLGGTATVRGDEKEPVIVRLSPLGKVSGRLFDREGKPLKGVEASIMGQSGFGRELYDALYDTRTREPVYTDKDGRFTVEGVIPNLKFWVRLRNERIIDTEPDLDDKQIRPGETRDFGDLRVKPAP